MHQLIRTHQTLTGGVNRRPFNRQQQVRFARTPAVTDAEVELAGMLEQFARWRLPPLRENRQRLKVIPVGMQRPLLLVKEANGNAAVVLHHGRAMADDEIADVRKMVAVHQIRSAFVKAVGWTELVQKFEKAAVFDV